MLASAALWARRAIDYGSAVNESGSVHLAERRKSPGIGAKPCYPMAETDSVGSPLRRSRPGLLCHCPFGALGRSDRVGWLPNGPPKPRRYGLTPTGRHAPKNRHAPKKPPCHEETALR